jgi:hypothetical protein
MIISRAFAQASEWTFSIKPIAALVMRYVGDGHGWVDPYAGKTSPAELTNDWNLEAPTLYHIDALDFAEQVCLGSYQGILFDPPYSYRQVSEHYRASGRKATSLDTSYNFYARVMDPLAERIVLGGYAISCGWNSNGFGKKRGFELVELLIVAHGLHHNDTIVTVERKIASRLEFYSSTNRYEVDMTTGSILCPRYDAVGRPLGETFVEGKRKMACTCGRVGCLS